MVGLAREVLTDMALNLSTLIKHNVNIFDVDGMIVGSSDLSRIGEYHAFAHSVIKGEIREYTVYDPSQENVRPGINLPILSNGKVIGAVGITGDPNEVTIFSEILKMSLETLIEQKLAEDKRMSSRKYEKQVVLDILFDLSGFEDIEKRLSVIGYKEMTYNLLLKFSDLDLNFKQMFRGLHYLEANMNDRVTFILSSDKMEPLMSLVNSLVESNEKVMVSEIVNFNNLKNEYKIINFVEQRVELKPKLYLTKDYKLDSFLHSLDYPSYAQFTEATPIITNATLVETFESLIKNDLSLVKTSEYMFVHINTLKYRIKKIEEMTGCSLKSVDDILKMKLSILSLKNKKDLM